MKSMPLVFRDVSISLIERESLLNPVCMLSCVSFFVRLLLMEGSAKAGMSLEVGKEAVEYRECNLRVALNRAWLFPVQ